MSYLSRYKKSDFKRLSWDEYGKTLLNLYRKIARYVKKNDIKIDAVVPILRAGAFPGTYLAYKFHVLRMLPVQYHYHFKGKKILLRQLLGLPTDISDIAPDAVFLVVEGNHCFGITAQTAIKEVKQRFPKSKILYAADHMDYSYQNVKGADAVFWGKLTNETRQLSPKEAIQKGIKNPLSDLFPWEDFEEEWTTVQGEQFKYKDVNTLEKCMVKREIEL